MRTIKDDVRDDHHTHAPPFDHGDAQLQVIEGWRIARVG
jgi:hypothetical protein